MTSTHKHRGPGGPATNDGNAVTRSAPAWIDAGLDEGGRAVLVAGGRWTMAAARKLTNEIRQAKPPRDIDSGARMIKLDLSRLEGLDTVGALLLHQLRRHLTEAGAEVLVSGVPGAYVGLLDTVWRAAETPAVSPPRRHPVLEWIERVGEATLEVLHAGRDLLAFFGLVCLTLARVIRHPSRLRWVPLLRHIEHMGFNALPILGLLAFLIGVVLAYQGADQMRRVGAEIYVVNLLGLSILRELGILITSIVVAGRSGSAIAAQIGTMKVNQEVDALLTLGLDPVELLVVPRILALMVALPLLTFFANMVALFGGATMSWILLDINYTQFLNQMRGPIDIFDATVAMIKAPVFALVIAMVGAHEGLQVAGSAESVGLRTTRAVVESIFLVIVLNAFFSILFSSLHI